MQNALLLAALFNNPCASSGPAEKLTVSGAGTSYATKGIFDPALTEDPSAGRIYMSYSAVDPAPTWWAPINYHTVSTRIAYSDDCGRSYTDSGNAINQAIDVILGDGVGPDWTDDAGTWHNEVSRLVYDPGAKAGEEWKLFWHHYLIQNQLGDPTDYRQFQHGWIAYKAASTPEGLSSATEVKLFGAAGYDSINEIQNNATSRSPLGGPPAIMLNTLDTDLNGCLIFSEPGAYARGSDLFVSLVCYELGPANNRVILLKISAQDDLSVAGNWEYIGTLFQTADAVALGYEKFSASELFRSSVGDSLMVTPVSDISGEDKYNGCLLFKFSDIDSGTLSGSPDIIKTISGTSGSFHGACTYHDSASSSGFLYSELVPSETDLFQIYKSHQGL